jgi:hypothetical protein
VIARRALAVALLLLAACAAEDERGGHPRRVAIEGADALRRAIDAHVGPVIVDYWAPR